MQSPSKMAGFFTLMSDENKLEIFEHLDELRSRLIVSVVVIFISFLICFNYSNLLFYLLKIPLDYQLGFSSEPPFFQLIRNSADFKLIFITPAEALWVHLKISLIFAVLISFPVIIIQVWSFLKPALYKKEKQVTLPFVIASILLFLTGIAFCLFIVLPFTVNFLLAYRTDDLIPMLTLEHYINFTLKFLLSFGVVFQTPIIILFLTKLNILTPKMLREGRKYAILIIFVIAAVLTPTPDIFNQVIMALPLIILYEISVIIADILYKGGVE